MTKVILFLLSFLYFLLQCKVVANYPSLIDIQYNYQYSYQSSINTTFTINGLSFINVTRIVFSQQNAEYECYPSRSDYNIRVDQCLKGISRNAMCALVYQQYPNFDKVACNYSQTPCLNFTSGKTCLTPSNMDYFCYNAICYNTPIQKCAAFYYSTINIYNQYGLAGVNCDENTVCSTSFRCVSNAPPDQCINHLTCSVQQINTGINYVTVMFADGTNATGNTSATQIVGFQPPTVTFVQNRYLSTGAVLDITFDPSLDLLNASVSYYACIDTTLQNQPFNITDTVTNAIPQLVYTSSTSVPLGTSITYPHIICMPVLDYQPYGFVAPLPDPNSNLTFGFLPLPQLYSVCPNQILSDLPETVVIQGDDFVNTPNLRCIFDENIIIVPVYISAKSVSCTLIYSNRTSPANVNLTLTNDGLIIANIPLIVNVIGACAKIKPNSIPSGSACICPAGFEDINNAYCQKCPDGFYQPNQNQQSCIPCDATETTNGVLGSLFQTACVCKSGLYKAQANQTSCSACPYGLDCTQAATGNYTVLPGFWRAQAKSTLIIPCAGGAKQCPAGNSGSGNQLCATGYKGPACSVCKKGYGLLGGLCLKCPDKGLNSFLLLLLIIVTLTLVYILVKSTTREEQKDDTLGVTIKVLIAYMQVLYYVGKTSAHWSNQSSRFFEALIPVTLSPSFLSIQCSTDFGFYSNITLMMILPLVVVTGVCLGHMLLWVFKNHQRPRSYFFMDAMDDNSKVTLVLLSLVHPTISQSVIRSFKCTSVEGTGTSFMTDDMRIDCSSQSYHRYVVIAALYTVFYIAGFLLLVMYRLFINKDIVDMANNGMYIMNAKIYVFFVRGYKRDYYLWEFMIIFRKVSIVIINSLFPDSIQLVWTNLVICFSLAYTVSAQPYRSFMVNRLDIGALLTLLFTITLGFHSKWMAAPNTKAVFVLLVMSNTLMTTLIILSGFKSLKPRIAKMLDDVVYYLDVNKYTRKEFFGSRHVNKESTSTVDIKMYTRDDYRIKNQQSHGIKSEETIESDSEVEL